MKPDRPKNRRPNAKDTHPSRRDCGSDGHQGKLSNKKKKKKRGGAVRSKPRLAPVAKHLPFEQVCKRLATCQLPGQFDQLPYALAVARRVRRPMAEDKAIEALIRAIVSFRPEAGSENCTDVQKLRSWVETKVDYAMRNVAVEYPVRRVRDAVLDFKARYGHLPTLLKLSEFSRISSHRILNVWSEVAAELQIELQNDPLSLSFRELLGWSALQVPEPDAHDVALVHRILKLMAPTDAGLLVLTDICGYSEQEILGIIGDARVIWNRTGSVDEVDSFLDRSVQAAGVEFNCPWDPDLFTIESRGLLAVRLFRARKKFRVVCWRRGYR